MMRPFYSIFVTHPIGISLYPVDSTFRHTIVRLIERQYVVKVWTSKFEVQTVRDLLLCRMGSNVIESMITRAE